MIVRDATPNEQVRMPIETLAILRIGGGDADVFVGVGHEYVYVGDVMLINTNLYYRPGMIYS